MKKRLGAVLLMAVILMMAGCGSSNSGEESTAPDIQITENTDLADLEENVSTEDVADCPAAFMVNDTIYLLEGIPMPAEVDESAIIGYTESYTDTFPEKNGETNFNPELGMPYAQVEDGIAVLYQNEWYLGTPFSNAAGENTISFDGVIIDHTLESIAPVICVKTLEEEVIPYETVFFELPDDEADWALQTNALVNIICDGAFTEQAPYFGTLISITGLTTEADNSIISVVNLWYREDAARLSPEDAAVIVALFEGGNWREGTSDCLNDCLLYINNEEIHYDSDCGTFNDEVNEKSLHLTEDKQAKVNAILEKYIALGVDGIKE